MPRGAASETFRAADRAVRRGRGDDRDDQRGGARGRGAGSRGGGAAGDRAWRDDRYAPIGDNPEPEIWIDEGRVDEVDSSRRPTRRPRRAGRPETAHDDVDVSRRPAGRLDDKTRAKLAAAGDAFLLGDSRAAGRAIKPLVDAHPDDIEVRELAGLIAYQQGRWRLAIDHLVEFERLGGGVDQHPVRADCHRALGQHDVVVELWEELGAASPAAGLVAEGRIVAAGSLADQGRVGEAIALLEAAPAPRRVQDHHLRQWYALADLHERAGDIPMAREVFDAIVSHQPNFGDAADRLSMLG